MVEPFRGGCKVAVFQRRYSDIELELSSGLSMANLTERETQVMRGLCMGKSNKDIARDYYLQEVTIKLHVKTLCRKLGAKNRTQAAMIAKDRRLI